MLGELMNQIVGDFTGNVGSELLVSINQNQPKMLTINKEVVVSIDTNLDRAQARRVSFSTANRNVFYMELAMDRTEFIQLHEFEREEIDPDRIVGFACAVLLPATGATHHMWSMWPCVTSTATGLSLCSRTTSATPSAASLPGSTTMKPVAASPTI